MTQDSDGELTPNPHNPIQQAVDAVQGQAIAQMVGGVAVGQLTVYLSQQPTETTTETITPAVRLGENPYQGLKAFRETDGDRFFGRGTQIYDLWQKFQHLHDDRATVRILPIYGPSGSGKSSLARAGLIPTLGTHLLPGRDRARVVVLTPGNHPLEALATVLARIATQDPTPVAKTREFREELMKANPLNEFDGLRRIASVFPDINFSPLIVLVDQFEEIYTLCPEVEERHAFVENLLCAASDPSQHVSAILTMRSDFLGATQQHPRLNKLFSSQGFLVPIMQPEELAVAITEPAKRAGYELDKATVQLLLEETQGQDGALPLLQFALTQIWEGLRQGVKPADTLEQIGGVGGALASEAKRLYEGLTIDRQRIARSIFLAVIQLNDDNKATRRRAPISELIASEEEASLVREVIDRFSRPGVWILVTSSNEQHVEMVEVAHEALIHNWKELQEWLKEHWQALRQKRKIEQAAQEWKEKKKSKDYLLQGRSLRDAREFMQAQTNRSETSLSNLAVEFLKAGARKQKSDIFKTIGIFFLFPLVGTIIITPEIYNIIQVSQIDRAKKIIYEDNCNPNPNTRYAIEYLLKKGYNLDISGMKLCQENLPNINLSDTDISKSDLREINLGGAKLQRSFLIEVRLQNAKLMDADLSRAILRNAKLQGTQLQVSILRDTIFKDANLQNANLEGADLSGADFSGANLSSTILSDASLANTDFRYSEGLSIEQLKQAKTLCGAKIPQEILKSSQEIRKLNYSCTNKE
jgi:uncharacterized protein YjbI with pentapeptide repeats